MRGERSSLDGTMMRCSCVSAMSVESKERPHFRVLGARVHAVQIPDVVGQMERWIRSHSATHFITITGMHGVTESQERPASSHHPERRRPNCAGWHASGVARSLARICVGTSCLRTGADGDVLPRDR